jgi:Tol biopolymer transport system component
MIARLGPIIDGRTARFASAPPHTWVLVLLCIGQTFLGCAKESTKADAWNWAPVPLTNDPARDWSPNWCPDGSQVAFLSERGGKTGIWVVPKSGGDASLVTDRVALNHALAWSSDGRRLAFTGSDSSGCYVGIIQFPEMQHTRLLEIQCIDTDLSWSPDGTRIAYTDRHGISLVGAETGDHSLIASLGDAHSEPRYAPDGEWLCVRAGAHWWVENLWIVSADGGQRRQLTAMEDGVKNPRWSPDGSEIACVGSEWDLWVVSTGTGGLVRLTNGEHWPGGPSWSPDGALIAYQSLNGIRIIRRSTGEQVAPLLVGGSPEWSPDGRSLVYTAAGESGKEDIYLVHWPEGGPESNDSPAGHLSSCPTRP